MIVVGSIVWTCRARAWRNGEGEMDIKSKKKIATTRYKKFQ
jgi:hypothetical protein